ncbi:MAG: outer membrane protein assembly factor BamE [Caulobacter sp.]
MFRPAVFAAAAIGLAAVVGGCTPLTSYSGFQAIEAKPVDMKVGEDSKSTVMEKLGSPSATSTFDNNAWYYVSQTTDRVAFYKPRVIKRDVVAIKFDPADEKVASVDTFTLKDGKVIAYNGRETPTRGREMTILEQLLGNVGRGGMLPQDDEGVPGTRPGDRR